MASSYFPQSSIYVFLLFLSLISWIMCTPFVFFIEIIFTITGTTSKGISLFSAISILSDGSKGFTIHRLVNAYHASGIRNSPYVGTYSYDELNYCDRLHILITFIYIITPLLTSTHKPVLARAPSSF